MINFNGIPLNSNSCLIEWWLKEKRTQKGTETRTERGKERQRDIKAHRQKNDVKR